MLAPSGHTDAVAVDNVMLRELPDGWVWTTIGSVTENFDGRRIPVTAMDRAAMRGPYPYYGASGVIDLVNRYLFDGTYLLITEDGVPLSQSKDIAFLASGKFWVNNHAHVVKTLGDLPLGFLKAYANSVNLQGYVTGTTRLKLTQAALNSIPVPLAPLPEQRRIVAEIEKQFTRLDASVDALKRVQANLKRYRASVLKSACEGKLVPTEAELARSEGSDYEPADQLLERILSARRAHWEAQEKRRGRYKELSSPDTSALSELPKGWVWATLSQISDLKGGATKGRRFRAGESLTEVPYLRVANVQRGYLDLSEIKTIEVTQEVADQLALVPGDILFTEGGDRDKLGRGWVWKGELDGCIHQNHIFRSRLLLTEMHPEFVSWWGNSFGQTFFEHSGKQTTNLASINLSVLSSFPVPLPPLAEQRRIVAEVERRLSVIQQAEATVEANLTRAERLRQSILKQAFSGKLVPQDPGDEPASALLERIRVEREASHADAKNSRQTRPRRGKSLSAQLVLREGNP